MTLLFLVFTVMTSSACEIADVQFLSGCWRTDEPGAIQRESWFSPTDNMMLGYSQRTDKEGKKTLGFEHLRLETLKDGTVGYFPDINGQRKADPFIFDKKNSKTKDGKRAIFINEKNDFPKKITYTILANKPKELHVKLSGGKTAASQEFVMTAEDCNVKR